MVCFILSSQTRPAYIAQLQFAVFVPISLLPLIIVLLWGQRKAKKVYYLRHGRPLHRK